MMYETYDKPADISFARLDRAIVHACKFLGLEDIYIVIEFEKMNCAGNCDIEEGEISITLNSNIVRQGNELELTIFHELVHIKQILDGKLVIGEGSEPSTWCDIIYTCSYKDLPWEVEAYKLEEEMLESFNGPN